MLALNINLQGTDPFANVYKEKITEGDECNKNITASFKQDAALRNSALSVSSNDAINVCSCTSHIVDMKNCSEKRYNDTSIESIQEKEIVNEDIYINTIASSSTENGNTQMQIDSYNDVVVSKNTQQLYSCIVGITCESNIEIINKGDRPIMYFLELDDISENIQTMMLHIPKNNILVKPNNMQCSKIKFKTEKMCGPVLTILNINIFDTITKSRSSIKHVICFVPRELAFQIACEHCVYDRYIRNKNQILPITLLNKDNIDIPIEIFISQVEPKMFSIECSFNESIKPKKCHKELVHIILKAQHTFNIFIKRNEIDSRLMDSSPLRSAHNVLFIRIQDNEGITLVMKEIPLHASIYKIQIIDCDKPIIVPRQQGRSLNIINVGNIATHVTATVLPLKGYPDAVQDFFIKPDTIFLQTGERGSFLIIYKPQNLNTEIIGNERNATIVLTTTDNSHYNCHIKTIIEESISHQQIDSARSPSYCQCRKLDCINKKCICRKKKKVCNEDCLCADSTCYNKGHQTKMLKKKR